MVKWDLSARKLNLSSLFASTYIVIGKKIGVKQSVDKIGIEPPPPQLLYMNKHLEETASDIKTPLYLETGDSIVDHGRHDPCLFFSPSLRSGEEVNT